MALVSGIFLGRGLADASQTIAQTVQEIVHRPLRRHGRVRLPSQELRPDGLGRDPRERQRRLKFRIRLALRRHNRMHLLDQFRMLLFGLGPTAIREIVETANAGPLFVQTQLDRLPSPAEHPFGLTGPALTILLGDFRLKLPTPKSRQLPCRRSNRFPHVGAMFRNHGLVLETVNSIPDDQKNGIA